MTKFYLINLLAGVVASFALPPFGMWFALFALSIPMIGAVNLVRDDGALKSAALLGWVTGAGWFVYSLSWISNALITSGGAHMLLIPFSLLGLPLFLGLFWAAAFMATHRIVLWCKLNSSQHVMLLIIMISIVEYVRGFILTGFPWNAPGLVLASNDIGLSTASVIGYWGGGLLALLFAALPVMAITAGRVGLVLCSAVILIFIGLGQMPTKPYPNNATDMTVRVIQPNIAQSDKWDFEKRRMHLSAIVAASRGDDGPVPALVVWPETAFAGIYERERGVASAFVHAATQGSAQVITGILSAKEDPFQLFNAVMIFGPDGQMHGQVNKRHLVPFGEFAPLRSIIPFVDIIAGPVDFTPGMGTQVLNLHKDKVTPLLALTLICYEVIFPSAVRAALVTEEADIIIAVTNDAWFGNTIGPRQHLAMAQMRSAELGVPMIRSANTGISAMIDRKGHVASMIDYDQSGTLDAIIGPSHLTIYRQYGDAIYFIMLVIFGGVIFALRLTKISPSE